MKRILPLTLALAVLGSTRLMALDLYITGSTAFRSQVFQACSNMFNTAPSIYYSDAAHGGDGTTAASNPQWAMTGQVGNKVTALGSTPLTIHAFFTGSIQGLQTVENSIKLTFPLASGTVGGAANAWVTNTPTIGFSDVSSLVTPYPAAGNYSEEQVAVQPFVFVKSVSTNSGMSSIGNVTWEQIRYAIKNGNVPLSTWSFKTNDHGTAVYLLERTKDSGTRRTELAQARYGFNQTANIYIYDVTNNFFYKIANPTGTQTNGSVGYAGGNVTVVGAAGANNANLGWGAGYVGGGDIKNEMKLANSNNTVIAYLSLADAKGITSTNWSQVLPFNGIWPTKAGAGIANTLAATNDFSPITEGMYPCWAYEVVAYPTVDPSSINGDQNLTAAQLGDQTTSGTILGVLDAQSYLNGGTLTVGSLENEIENSKGTGVSPNGATAIRISDMVSSRTQSGVGDTIAP